MVRVPVQNQGIVDIAAFEPDWTFEIPGNSPPDAAARDLNEFIQRIETTPSGTTPRHDLDEIFNGGLIGYCSYELGRDLILDKADQRPGCDQQLLPKFFVGYFSHYLLIDHSGQKVIGVMPEEIQEQLNQSTNMNNDTSGHLDSNGPFSFSGFQGDWDTEDYSRAFRRLIDYIYSGDTYQANLTQRFQAEFQGNPWAAFKQVHQQTDAPHSAYISTPHGQVLSFSPESFLSINQGVLSTKPIKGTRPRSAERERDNEIAEELLSSPKDRAENVMIVDLLRNDLGKVANTGSVRVEKLCALETFSNVHHLVSTITAELKSDISPLKALIECLPGGSITGAPKKRAMEIIEELEPYPRSIYCGSVFTLGRNGRLESNIAIRTLVCCEGQAYLWGGGGIVADSQFESEYEESLVKIRHIAKALGVDLNPKSNSH